ncbi:putative pyrophosphatase [Oleiphilus messinensis]|uniref:Putative pyrophosphatase n=1 Tax=Oleiphilus messinensis TaxID=141451 RepID=A0A1Y0I6C0_9GAMM|nr:nucleoside triphosphate pyrophosphohydrolase [Oleiphilus messinensis]ARU55336.1 putative pyrophosphatase [Oleiphilus messinensis]
MASKYDFQDLLYLMTRLRDPEDGCPWDQKQSYASIVPHTLEEAYEVAEAIENEDFANLKEELGDLLFQVVFYSEIAREEQRFSFAEIVDTLVAKLIRRHPHVFPDGTLASRLPPGTRMSDAQIKANWERIKADERQEKVSANDAAQQKTESILDSIAHSLPPLAIAEKLQRKAAHVGFDWPDIDPVFDKLQEEISELKEAWHHLHDPANQQLTQADDAQKQAHIEEELGDILFVCVNLSRFLKVDAGRALAGTNRKFRDRFRFIEAQLEADGKSIHSASLTEMDRLWNRAKGKD